MTRGQRLFVVLNGLFLAFLIVAELTASKLIDVDVSAWLGWAGIESFTPTMGVIPFPMTFLLTDVLNEYYGRRGVRFTTLLGFGAVACVYAVLLVDLQIPAASFSPVSDEAFRVVFANSGAVILGSMAAYLVSQFVDIHVFHFVRKRTRERHIWLRATGSTVVSQLIDSFVVIYVAFGTGLGTTTWSGAQVTQVAATNYVYKLLVAVALTPAIYLVHAWIDRYLGPEAATLEARAREDRAFAAAPPPG